MDSEHDYYSILDVPRDASDADIRRAFRSLAKEHHPDSRGAGNGGGSAERDFRLISEAYETLKDSNRRAAYDRELDEARQLEPHAANWGKRSFAAGLGVGILVAIVAVGALNYIDRAGRMSGEKAQDLLKIVIGSEKPPMPVAAFRLSETRTGSRTVTPALPSEAGKAPPPPTPVQPASAAPSPIDVSARLPAERQAPAVSGEAGGKSNDKSVTLAPIEPLEIATGTSGHKKTVRILPGKGLTQSFTDCHSCPEMVVIPAGEALIGSRVESDGSHWEEAPAHRVHFSRPLAISKYCHFGRQLACVRGRWRLPPEPVFAARSRSPCGGHPHILVRRETLCGMAVANDGVALSPSGGSRVGICRARRQRTWADGARGRRTLHRRHHEGYERSVSSRPL